MRTRTNLILLRKARSSKSPVTEASADKLPNIIPVKPPLSADFFAGDIPILGQSVDRSDVNPEIIGNLLYGKHLTVHLSPPKKKYNAFRSYSLLDDKSNIYTTKTANRRGSCFLFYVHVTTILSYWNY